MQGQRTGWNVFVHQRRTASCENEKVTRPEGKDAHLNTWTQLYAKWERRETEEKKRDREEENSLDLAVSYLSDLMISIFIASTRERERERVKLRSEYIKNFSPNRFIISTTLITYRIYSNLSTESILSHLVVVNLQSERFLSSIIGNSRS